jgi:prophage regulatory protein
MSERALQGIIAEHCPNAVGLRESRRSEPRKPTTILRMRQLTQRIGMSRSWVYLAVSDGRFPQPIKLARNGTAVGWLESEVEAYLSGRIEETRGGVKLVCADYAQSDIGGLDKNEADSRSASPGASAALRGTQPTTARGGHHRQAATMVGATRPPIMLPSTPADGRVSPSVNLYASL